MISLYTVKRVLRTVFQPIKGNAAFFVFMYALGLVCVYATVPDKRGYHAWPLAPYDLFVDVGVLCLLLWLLPRKISLWVRRLMYFVAYLLAVIDVYCFVEFDSTITPTMLLLVGETDSREASEFLSSYVSADLISSRLGWVLLVMALHVVWAVVWNMRERCLGWLLRKMPKITLLRTAGLKAEPFAGLAVVAMFVFSIVKCADNKIAFVRLMSYENIGSVEHELTKKEKAVLNQPLYRLVFSIYANRLTARQVKVLVRNIDNVKVDSCSFRSKNIVLIIGESYNRHHASLYGYTKDTTPRQKRRARRGELIPFSDVVSPWNLKIGRAHV